MTDYIKYLHTAIFTGPTGCGKNKLWFMEQDMSY